MAVGAAVVAIVWVTEGDRMGKIVVRRRIKGWQDAHKAVIDRHMALPFEWGVSDCLILMVENASAITGFDYFKLGGKTAWKYTTAAGAQKLMLKRGYNDVAEVIADYFPQIAPTLAQRGDLAIVDVGGVQAGGVFTSLGVMVKDEDTPVQFLPVSSVVWAFKVG